MADNDEYDDVSLDELNELGRSVPPRKMVRSVTTFLPETMIRKALTPAQLTMLRRDSTICVVIEAPTADWVDPMAKAAKRLGDWKFIHAAKEAPKPNYRGDVSGDQAVLARWSHLRHLP